jgi:O-antigen ligase/tetratricopeptide (TPR) repeat protein
MEFLTLVMVVLAPWAFGGVHPASILVLDLGISLLLLLWAGVMVLDRGLPVSRCPVFLCLAAFVAIGLAQIVPLGPAVLSTLSPATVALRADLYPAEPEAVPLAEAVPPPAETISFDPAATRGRVVQLLALLALFAVVRFSVARPGAFIRFAVVCTVNGALLSFLALAQRFSSPPDTIYWSFPSLGAVFGPFVCRNNFSDYANVCLFLAAGLLLRNTTLRSRGRAVTEWLVELGQNSTALWLLLAVGLTAAAVFFSLSRGGVIALAAGAICFIAFLTRTNLSGAGLKVVGLAILLSLGIIVWLGTDVIGQRLGTLNSESPDKGRRELWARSLTLASRFPLVGTGYATFETVEPQTRHPGDERLTEWEHAHNDYLEVLVEGGLVQFGVLMLLVGFAFRNAFRAFHGLRGRPDGALALGGLCGLVAVAVHSLGDFGMHIPAVAVLVTVLAAHLMALGDARAPTTPTRSIGVLVPAVAACLGVAAALPVDGWFRERAEFYRLAAVHAALRLPVGDRDTVIRYLRTAAAFAPDDASIRLRLADAEYEEYAAHTTNSPASTAETGEWEERCLKPALHDYLLLRSENPLHARSHARLAAGRHVLVRSDSVQNYLSRATRLRPTDEGLWYLAGLDRVAANDLQLAWAAWQNSLRCAATHLPEILPTALGRLGPGDTAEAVIPPESELFRHAARTPPLSEREDDRRQFAARAATLLSARPPEGGADLYARAWLLREADRRSEAIPAYEAALTLLPDSVECRLELAELLLESGSLDEAERQIRRVLQQSPTHEAARELNSAIVRARTKTR